ncbi:MAG: hypothetical protein KatS3mg111_1838 [Pirellulaceae bacterium]|nr:MAG: hypothetical protein KatS3mg111_1838 [Pirellulaceae bacterium]
MNRRRAKPCCAPNKRGNIVVILMVFCLYGCTSPVDSKQEDTLPAQSPQNTAAVSPLSNSIDSARHEAVFPPATGASTTTSSINDDGGRHSGTRITPANSTSGDDATRPVDVSFITLSVPLSSSQLRDEASLLMTQLSEQWLPTSTDAQEVASRYFYLVGENERADEIWQRALELDPNYGYAYLGRGKVAMRQERWEDAIDLLTQAVELLPGLEEPINELAKAKMVQADVAGAITILEKYTSTHNDAAESWLLLAQSYAAKREHAAARDAYRQVLELRPESPRAEEGLGRALLRLGERDEGRRLLEKQAIARRESEQTNRSRAEVFADECLDFAKHYTEAAKVLRHHGQVVAAQHVLDKATWLAPHHLPAWNLLLQSVVESDDLHRAIRLAMRMCHENASNPSAWLSLARLHLDAGQTDSALAAYDRVLTLLPDDANVQQLVARVLLDSRRDPKRALALTRKAVELRGNSSDHEALAQALAANGNMKQAREHLIKAIEIEPENAHYRQSLHQLDTYLSSKRIDSVPHGP